MQQADNKEYCTLYIVRHGETEWNVKRITQGQSESYLTENGKEQARETAEKFKDITFAAIFSSDLVRTQQTAEILKLDRDIIIQTSKLLRERTYGSFEGKHADEFRNAFKDKLKERDALPEVEHESFRFADDVETDGELVGRFIIQLREIAVAYPNQNVLVVTHAGCIKSFLVKTGYLERNEIEKSGSFKNGGYVRVLSDGVDFFIKEVEGIMQAPTGGE